MKHEKFSIQEQLKSFQYAFNGLKILISEEPKARIHLVASCCAGIAGWVFRISKNEWIAVILCIAGVWALEAVNSAIEDLSDFVSIEQHETIKKIKDLSAAAVFIAAIAAAIIGVIVFLPKIIGILYSD
ncbi:MAG: diacylglycerol kinase family protein [Candidatus Azobacteroides sp.]|nr:diacylglycerol kinase family protein [Candidatus Azobacteroides sp.]